MIYHTFISYLFLKEITAKIYYELCIFKQSLFKIQSATEVGKKIFGCIMEGWVISNMSLLKAHVYLSCLRKAYCLFFRNKNFLDCHGFSTHNGGPIKWYIGKFMFDSVKLFILRHCW